MSISTLSKPMGLVFLVASTLSLNAAAQSRDQFDDSGLSFKLGETDLFPSVRIDYLQNSNAFLQPDNETASTAVTISPELRWVADRRLVQLQGRYNGRYNVSSEDALTVANHQFSLNADAELSSRKRLSGGVSLNFGHEALGTNFTRGSASEDDDPVTFADFTARSVYRYGADQAKGNLSFGVLLRNFDYTSRSDLTNNSGYVEFEPFAGFSYRLSGDTRLLSEIRFGTLRFENSARDRNDLTLLAGIQFDATGKSGGAVRFGILQSQRTLDAAEDQTEFVLRASLFWEPTSFSRFDLLGTRSLDNRGSSFVNADSLSGVEDLVRLTWNHEWSSRVSHVAVVQSQNYTTACPELDDNTLSGRLEFNIQIRRWLSVGVNGTGTTRDVPGCPGTENADPNLDYERTRVGAHFRATL